MAFRPCSRKLFVMANKVCTPFSAASKLFERVSESAHWDRQHLLSIMGYNGAGETRHALDRLNFFWFLSQISL
jgi:hypothetical protein